MKKLLLMIMLWPLLTAAQEVKPVLSADYLALISNDSLPPAKNKDVTHSMNKATQHVSGAVFYGYTVKKITADSNSITLHPLIRKSINITGTVSSIIERQYINRLPAVQEDYVQGRSVNGALAWQGPETGEPFSYGPAIGTLEFDGSNYPYDVNGRLTTAGNGRKAMRYNNSVFRPATLFSHTITLNGKYRRNSQPVLSGTLKAGQDREQTFIRFNNNKTDHFSASLEATLSRLSISSSYNFRQERFSHNNRNGFLNRVYQNSLLSPVSFDTRQGNTIGAAQRTYSPQADNPLFLLANEEHSFLQQQQTGNIVIEKKFSHAKIKLLQSVEKVLQHSNEGYRPGTAFFPAGMAVERATHDDNYLLHANMEYNIRSENYHFNAQATVNYIYANNRSVIAYSPAHETYRYQRSSHDMALGFAPAYNSNNIDAGLAITNKIYASNTSTTDQFLLPSIAGYTRFNNLLRDSYLSVKLFGSVNRFNSELPIDKSFAGSSLVKYSVSNALQFLPVTEVNSFNNLDPIEHREYTAGVEMTYKNKLGLSANWFSRHTANDIFPVINGGQIRLVNMANYRNRGIELVLDLYDRFLQWKQVNFSNTISFISYRSKVTDVKDGYNFTPVAGFSEVHTAIVKGQPLGVIVSNTWLRDINNNPIIGNDGFPLVNNTPAVTGNPVPSFIIKLNHRFGYKNWNLNIDWEWKKGGAIWNGTQALLDYYGRSAATAAQRGTVNYVFGGVLANGTHNNIPVSFYDPSLPVGQNRWVRYGHSGVGENYIQKADCIRLNTVAVVFRPVIKKYLQQLSFTLYANNIIIWSPYKGADPDQLLNDQPGASGLDFFNLPSTRSIGFTVTLQF